MREYVRFTRSRNMHVLIGVLLDVLDYALITLFVIVLLCIFVFHFAAVQGDSMLPTLQDGNQLLVNALDRQPEQGEIIIINASTVGLLHANGTPYEVEGLHKVIVKRVIAVAGDTVNIDFDNGIVYVNGEAIEEAYLDGSTNNKLDFIGPQTVPENCLFVMGDNRNASTDSRDKRIGMVDKRLVIGKVLLVVYPFSDFGGVE